MTRPPGIDDDPRWAALLAAAQTGDGEAYRLFLAEILPFVRAVARNHGCADPQIEDVVQDALLTLHRVRHTYEPGRRVKPWLATIVARRAIDARRRRQRVARHEVSNPYVYETFADPDANKAERAASAAAVGPLLDQLTPGQREAIELVKLREMSLAEASAESGQSVAALKVNLHRALKRLRRAFGAGGAS